MANVRKYTEQIASAKKGKDVRAAIVSAINEVSDENNTYNQTKEDIQAALDEARTYTDAPTIIEFMISTDEIVLPMVKSGNPMSEMILK